MYHTSTPSRDYVEDFLESETCVQPSPVFMAHGASPRLCHNGLNTARLRLRNSAGGTLLTWPVADVGDRQSVSPTRLRCTPTLTRLAPGRRRSPRPSLHFVPPAGATALHSISVCGENTGVPLERGGIVLNATKRCSTCQASSTACGPIDSAVSFSQGR